MTTMTTMTTMTEMTSVIGEAWIKTKNIKHNLDLCWTLCRSCDLLWNAANHCWSLSWVHWHLHNSIDCTKAWQFSSGAGCGRWPGGVIPNAIHADTGIPLCPCESLSMRIQSQLSLDTTMAPRALYRHIVQQSTHVAWLPKLTGAATSCRCWHMHCWHLHCGSLVLRTPDFDCHCRLRWNWRVINRRLH